MPRDIKGTGHDIGRHDGPIGGGPVGNGGYEGRPSQGKPGSESEKGVLGGSGSGGLLLAALAWLFLGRKGGGSGGNGSGGSGSLGKIIRIAILVLLVIFLFRACASNSSYYYEEATATSAPVANTPAPVQQNTTQQTAATSGSVNINDLIGSGSLNNSYVSTNEWTGGNNTASVNAQVVQGAREKFYKPADGDKVTVMLYMIGTDLESNGGMATSDLQEIANAAIGDNVNFLVYGGGCAGWKNNIMSNKENVVYQVFSGGQFKKLGTDGDKTMTDPATLSGYIQFAAKYFPAERNILVLWDHGGGSLTGYGYDQRHKNSGSMTLNGIKTALKDGGVKFDFVGFDACLMATTETALAISDYADYMVASEESEPGIGWYYTNWVSLLSKDSDVDTVKLGKQICDDFVTVCGQQCRGQDTTLSVTDLAELSYTLPDALSAFSNDTEQLIKSNGYRNVSSARANAKEFARGNGIDQVDITSLCVNLNTASSRNLAETITNAIKYNLTSSTVRNAYGLSIYWPYSNNRTLNTALTEYSKIGMNSDYSKCIQAFAGMSSAGQSTSSYGGYSSSPFGSLSGSGNSYTTSITEDILYSILQSAMSGRSIPVSEDESTEMVAYLSDNQFNASNLVWTDDANGDYTISMSEDQWKLINELVLNLFVDDGEGYIDMGTFWTPEYLTESGNLNGVFDRVWIALGDYFCAYYMDSADTGRIPVLYNGERANLLVSIGDDGNPSIAGIRLDYKDGETDTVAKSQMSIAGDAEFTDIGNDTFVVGEVSAMAPLKEGDEIILIADYYDYGNNYQDSYKISEPIIIGSDTDLEFLYLTDNTVANACFRLTDIYSQVYWTPVMK